MGFMDKAKKFAQETQQQAKDGTLKDRAKAMAEQAQKKLDDVQGQFNEGQRSGAPASSGPVVDYDVHGRPVQPDEQAPAPAASPEAEAVAEAAATVPDPVTPPAAPSAPAVPDAPPEALGDVDRSADQAPKVTGGDPLAG